MRGSKKSVFLPLLGHYFPTALLLFANFDDINEQSVFLADPKTRQLIQRKYKSSMVCTVEQIFSGFPKCFFV